MTNIVIRQIAQLDDVLLTARWSLIISAVLFGASTSDRIAPHGIYHEDGGGSWLQLLLLEGDRAVAIGVDRDFSETVGERPGLDEHPEIPDWVQPCIPREQDGSPLHWWGYLLWWDEGAWWSVDHELDDGVGRVEVLSASADRARRDDLDDMLSVAGDMHLTEDDPREELEPDPVVVRRAVEAGPALTEEMLREAGLFEELDLAAGVEAARAFGRITPMSSGAEMQGKALGPA